MMRKFTGTDEKPKVLTPDQHKKVSKILGKIGKTSAENLTDEERENLTSSLESDRQTCQYRSYSVKSLIVGHNTKEMIMPNYQPRRGLGAVEQAASRKGGSKFRGFVPEIRWREDGEKKYILVLSNFENDDPNAVVVADLHEFIPVGTGEKANGETYTKYESFVSRKDPIAGSEDFDDLEDRLGNKPRTRCIGVAVELEPEFEVVKGRNRPVGFKVKTDSFTRNGDNGQEEVEQPLIGLIVQSAFLMWSPLGSLDESQGPLSELPVEITRRGKDVNSRYDFVPYMDMPVDLSPLFENLGGITYIADELGEVQDDIAAKGDIEAAQMVGQLLIDKRLRELADKDRYEELVGPIQVLEQRFGGGSKKPAAAARPAARPAATSAGTDTSRDSFEKLKERFATKD